MQLREYSLPAGWFPRGSEEVSSEISRFLSGKEIFPHSRAVISPHAGWYYSGSLAALSIANLDKDAQTVAVFGGHLPSGSPPLFAMEDAVRTPFGAFSIDTELRSALVKEINGKEDKYRDNTVEVLLPMVHFFFPEAQVLWLRLGEDMASFEAGKTVSKTAGWLGRKINVIASTDLTHYGNNYGFSPKGGGAAALRWVRDVNDASFIKAVESADAGEVLRRACTESSSCSAGAVLGAMGFAGEEKLGSAHLLEYATSADINKSVVPDSFVGYAAMAFK
ncbi:MAG: AmmeMemoRadiSam system protein B [Treponema sp.]|nr:AmmeMemoRadiSam system protein B [Treponema sp.]MCL2272262.1 AmmeMemoRadiSam system protein B [Treponema sp.]